MLDAFMKDPSSLRALEQLAQLHLEAERPTAAAALATAGLVQAPGRAALRRIQASAFERLGRPNTDPTGAAPQKILTVIQSLAASAGGPGHATAERDAFALAWREPNHPAVWQLTSALALTRHDFELAEACAAAALARNPHSEEAWRQLALTVTPRNGPEAGFAVIDCALARGIESPAIIALAENLARRGNRLAALAARLDTPAVCTEGLLARIRALQELDRNDECLAVCIAAVERHPDNVAIFAGAAAALQAMVDGAPLQALIEHAKYNDSIYGSREAQYFESIVLHKQGNLKEALARVEHAEAMFKKAADGQRGLPAVLKHKARCLEAMGRHDSAFEALQAGNKARLVFGRRVKLDPDEYLAELDHLFEIARSNTEVALASRKPTAPIAFAVGFPRSGTTLLDNVLRSHSRVRVFEETDIFTRACVSALMEHNPWHQARHWRRIAERIDPDALLAAYLEGMASFMDAPLDPGFVHVDKHPLHLGHVFQMAQMAPGSAVIVSVRHPFDCAISCLKQNFTASSEMLNFTSLQRIDAVYGRVFDIWDAAEARFTLNSIIVRYEDMVDDLEAALSPVMNRLGLDWEEGQARFFETARARARIRTASASQVVQPIYRSSVEGWRDYAFAFASEELPNLQRLAERWGYDLS